MLTVDHLMQTVRLLGLSLTLPPTPFLILMAAAWFLRPRWRRIAGAMAAVGVTGAWLFCTEAGAVALKQLLIGEGAEPTAKLYARLETLRDRQDAAVFVLGGGARQWVEEYQGPRLKTLSLQRLDYGVWLAERYGLRLGFTGGLGRRAEPGDRTEAELAQAHLSQARSQRFQWIESTARDTRENAGYSAALVAKAGLTHLVLVTHSQHMPRAMLHFRRALGPGVELLAAPVGLRDPSAPLELADWLPSVDGMAQSRYCVYEWLALRLGH